MYTEIQEATNFLSTFLYSKVPRRKVCLFAETMANFLVLKYNDSWNPLEPKRDESHRVLEINVRGQTEPLLAAAAATVGIEFDEILHNLPTELRLYINPGEVKYRVGDEGGLTYLYNSSESTGSTLNKMMGPGGDAGELKLNLSNNSNIGANWLVGAKTPPPPVFELSSCNDVNFTVGSFAMTRFGTTKQKTNIAALKQIQRKAASTRALKQQQHSFENVDESSFNPLNSGPMGMGRVISTAPGCGMPLMPPGMFGAGPMMSQPVTPNLLTPLSPFRPPPTNFFRPSPPPPFWTPSQPF